MIVEIELTCYASLTLSESYLGASFVNGLPGDVFTKEGDRKPDHLTHVAYQCALIKFVTAYIEECVEAKELTMHVAMTFQVLVESMKQW